MSCSNCSPVSPLSFDVQMFFSNNCFSQSTSGCSSIASSACVAYLGPNLSCSGVNTNDSIETALQKIDTHICSAIGDYSTYQFNCLTAWYGSAITQESQFVDAITGYACQIESTLTSFTGVTFPSYQDAVSSRFAAVETPSITCSSASVTPSDNLETILQKYCTTFGDLYDKISLSGVTWDACYTVVTPPTVIADAFQLLADQICQTKALTSGAPPTFDNTGTCLPSPGTTDSLVSTIGKITTRLCQSPTLDNTSLSSSCVSIPGTATDLQTLLQTMLGKLDTLLQAYPTYSADFAITAAGGSPCDGINVALATPLDVDRYVASNASDTTPGTLATKLSTNGSIVLDFSDNSTAKIDVSNGDKGDVTVSGTGSTWTIDNKAVTYPKIQDVTTNRILGRVTAGNGTVEEIAPGSRISFSGGIIDTINFDDGSYTPTITNVLNINSTVAGTFQYLRVGYTVTVSGRVSITFTNGSTISRIGIELPIPSPLQNDMECAGVAVASGDGGQIHSIAIHGDSANTRAEIYGLSPSPAGFGDAYYVHFTYRIITAEL